jgi:CHASE2 domain-containing sensor protein
LLDGGSGQDYIGIAIFIASGLTWFIMALATALAVKQVGGRGPAVLMTIGAAIFAVGHPFPTGPIGIALFGLGVAWLELRREAAKAPETQPALAP